MYLTIAAGASENQFVSLIYSSVIENFSEIGTIDIRTSYIQKNRNFVERAKRSASFIQTQTKMSVFAL